MAKEKRVAIYYEHRLGRNDGAPLYYFNLLKDKKLYPNVEAHHLIPDGNYKNQGKFDLHLWIDWGEDGLKDILPYEVVLPKHDREHPLVYVASDTHLGPDYRFEMAKKADYIFFNQKPAVQDLGVEIHSRWLPHAVEPRAFPNTPKALKKYDVCFVGHLVSQERIDFLDRAFKEFPNFWFGKKLSRYIKDDGQQDDCADIYRKSKIILNPPTKHEVNMRVFEALATESLMITEDVEGIRDLFEDGKHLVLYKTIDEAMDKIRYYLDHDDEREAIAKAGYEEVIAKHTYQHRLNTILKTCGIIN